jgi:hypothetical protein
MADDEVYWSLLQALAYALTRDEGFADALADAADPGSRQVDIKIAIKIAMLNRAGRDIKAELRKIARWDSALMSRPAEMISADVTEGRIEAGVEYYSSPLPARSFSLEHYFVDLFRAGRIKTIGKGLGDTEWRALSPVQWNDLELSHHVLEESVGVESSVLVATPIKRRGVPSGPEEYLLIQILKAAVLREFPAEPPAEAASSEATEQTADPLVEGAAPEQTAEPPIMTDEQIKAEIHAVEKKEGHLTLRRAREIFAANNGPGNVPNNVPPGFRRPTRNKVDQVWRTLNPDAESGRPSKQK